MRLSADARLAVRDYYRLLCSGYPPKATLKVVGDRYRLDEAARSMLYRGVAPATVARARRRRLCRRMRDRSIHVDGYNVLYTVASYLLGRPVFVANDGFLRDSAERHGRAPDGRILDRAVDLVLARCVHGGAREVYVYLDSPVSHSGELASRLEAQMRRRGIAGQAFVVRSPDRELRAVGDGLVATSDSAVIDRCRCRVLDLARGSLEDAFSPKLLRLSRCLGVR